MKKAKDKEKKKAIRSQKVERRGEIYMREQRRLRGKVRGHASSCRNAPSDNKYCRRTLHCTLRVRAARRIQCKLKPRHCIVSTAKTAWPVSHTPASPSACSASRRPLFVHRRAVSRSHLSLHQTSALETISVLSALPAVVKIAVC